MIDPLIHAALLMTTPILLAAIGGLVNRVGGIVNIGGTFGFKGVRNASLYGATKWTLRGLTKSAALEYATQGIRVNAVGPAFIDTPLLADFEDAARQALIAKHPIGRLGTAEEDSALVLFLLSEQASFITGSYHLVDGGYAAQ